MVSSTYRGQLAGTLGLPYAFASHFAPTHLHDALWLYHPHFEASNQLKKPYAMACVNIVVANADEEAEYLAMSMKLFMLNVIRSTRHALSPLVKSMSGLWSPMEEAHISQMMQYTFVGSKETVRQKFADFVDETRIDETIAVAHMYDQTARLRSFEFLSQIN